MNTQSENNAADSSDARLIASLIIELNIARRNSLSYPEGHPVVTASLSKVLGTYEDLFQIRGEIILGVTNDALMLDGSVLEKSNVVYRGFSQVLFERGIGALLFHDGLTIEELKKFTHILSLKREQIQHLGGIEQVWTRAGITSVSIRPIRYDLFQSKEENSFSADIDNTSEEGVWERFARELTQGELSTADGAETGFDPEIVAEIINNQFVSGTISPENLRRAVSAFSEPVDVSSIVAPSGQPYKKLAAFVSELTPELRRQFLDSSFSTNNQAQLNATQNLITHLSDSAIMETLEDINQNRLHVSPVIFGLLQRLSQNVSHSPSENEDLSADNALSDKMKTLFREHASEEFVPDDYQKKLNTIISSDQISRLNMEEVTGLLQTFESRSIESSIGHILINLIRDGIETPEERDLLLQNLTDMFGLFLQTGDYDQLHAMVDQIADDTFPAEMKSRLKAAYGCREFQEEILDGLIVWGKSRYNDIRSLIHKIGGPFVDTLLDRLSAETNMSLRRFYMDCLIEMGPITRDSIVERLQHDTRWYFLRNLLIIITAQNDLTVLPEIRLLLRNEDPRLRQEVLKILVHFRDPQVEKQIMDDLDSQSPELQAAAIQLAEQCKSPAIAARLIGMVTIGGYSQTECEKKCTIVRALGEIGRVEVLPELAKILSSRSLLNARHLARLKTDIIRSLPKYPYNVSRPILEHIAAGSGENALLAAETLSMYPGKSV